MVEAGREPRFAKEALAERLVVTQLRREQLQSDRALERQVLCPVDDAHPTVANQRLESVAPELRADLRHPCDAHGSVVTAVPALCHSRASSRHGRGSGVRSGPVCKAQEVRVIPRALRVGGLFVALAFMLGLAGAASGGNQTTYTDATGDNEHQSNTYYASDIRSVQVTSADNGGVSVAVTPVDADGRMVTGDNVRVYVNLDRKSSTGDHGYDYELLAVGQSSGQPTFDFCSLASPVTCQAGQSGFGAETYPSSGTHVVTF